MARAKNKKWPGLKAAAKRLGISYGHLRLVLTGKSSSPSLLEKYRARFDAESGQPLKPISASKPQPTKKP